MTSKKYDDLILVIIPKIKFTGPQWTSVFIAAWHKSYEGTIPFEICILY